MHWNLGRAPLPGCYDYRGKSTCYEGCTRCGTLINGKYVATRRIQEQAMTYFDSYTGGRFMLTDELGRTVYWTPGGRMTLQ
jgi:hypothetical protein